MAFRTQHRQKNPAKAEFAIVGQCRTRDLGRNLPSKLNLEILHELSASNQIQPVAWDESLVLSPPPKRILLGGATPPTIATRHSERLLIIVQLGRYEL